ncbi:MAG TPA: hypothetical protein VF821_18055, partial [Lentzea sp.]
MTPSTAETKDKATAGITYEAAKHSPHTTTSRTSGRRGRALLAQAAKTIPALTCRISDSHQTIPAPAPNQFSAAATTSAATAHPSRTVTTSPT